MGKANDFVVIPEDAELVSMPRPRSLAEAMAVLQQNLPKLEMTRTVEVGGGKKAPYADLSAVSEAILPELGRLGLSFIAAPTIVDGKPVLRCELRHINGDSIEALYPLTGTTHHQIGSAITYGRRYCLGAMTGLTPEDDDGGAAAQAASAPRTAQRAQRQERPTAQRAQPPLPADDGKMTGPQRGKLNVLFDQVGVKDREERLNYVNGVIDREVTSSGDLTKDEASKVIESLIRWADQSEPDGGE